MSIERALTAIEKIADSLAAIAVALAAAPASAAPEAAAPEAAAPEVVVAKTPRKRTAPPAVEAAPEPAPEQEVELAAAEPMDYEILKRAVLELGAYNEEGRAFVLEILASFNVRNAQMIPPEAREGVHTRLLAKLTELQNAEEFA